MARQPSGIRQQLGDGIAAMRAQPTEHIRGPKDGERYFALLKVSKINFEDPEATKHKR